MRTSNNRFQRDANLAVAARAVWRRPGLSRADLARELGLHRSTAGSLIGALIESGLLVEGEPGAAAPRGGRRPVAIDFDRRFGLVAGLDLTPGSCRGALADLRGDLVERFDAPSGSSLPELARAALDEARARAAARGLPLVGACAALPGIVDPIEGTVLRSRPFGLRDYPLGRELAPESGYPLIVENDANACAWARLANARTEPASDFICVLARGNGELPGGPDATPGAGLGIALGGRVHYGSLYAAGELADADGRAPGDHSGSGTDGSFGAFVERVFRSLAPVLVALAPRAVFACGEFRRREAETRAALETRFPAFRGILAGHGAAFVFAGSGEHDVAEGACATFLSRLFSVPELSGPGARLPIGWDRVLRARAGGA
ncbi:MAG: ROK family transcriptional regulator [Spirochaetales bacterium]|nr:ROK family transcriptional regulator [Spirochaetales bacterium]